MTHVRITCMSRRILLLGAVGALALAAAGCGGSGVDADTTATPTNPTSTVATPTVATTATPTVVTVSTVPSVPTTSSTPTFGTTPTSPTTPTTSTVPTTPSTTQRQVPTTPQEPQRPRHLRPGAHVVPPTTYTRDVLLSLSALRSFSSTLQSIDSASEFRSRLTSLRSDLRTFDGIIRRLRSYQLMSPVLDKQRARLAQQGPGLARAMSDFLDAVRDGNATRARSLASDVMTRLSKFRKAA